MKSELEPLSSELEQLLALAQPPEPPDHLEAATLDALRSEIGALAAAGLVATAAGAVSPAASFGWKAALGKWGVYTSVAAFAAGGAGGVVVQRELQRRRPPPPPVVLVAPPPAPSAPEVVEAPPAPDPGRVSKPKAAKAPAAAPVEHLAEERRLLERARSALLRREASLALAPLQEHARRFPGGQLREERDSLLIQVHLSTGERELARRALEAFRQRYPNSLLLPALEAAVDSEG